MDVDQLYDLFPHFDRDVLSTVLSVTGSLDAAIDELLSMQDSGASMQDSGASAADHAPPQSAAAPAATEALPAPELGLEEVPDLMAQQASAIAAAGDAELMAALQHASALEAALAAGDDARVQQLLQTMDTFGAEAMAAQQLPAGQHQRRVPRGGDAEAASSASRKNLASALHGRLASLQSKLKLSQSKLRGRPVFERLDEGDGEHSAPLLAMAAPLGAHAAAAESADRLAYEAPALPPPAAPSTTSATSPSSSQEGSPRSPLELLDGEQPHTKNSSAAARARAANKRSSDQKRGGLLSNMDPNVMPLTSL